jgi:hypothetical protein
MNEGDLFDLQDIRALLERELVGTAYAVAHAAKRWAGTTGASPRKDAKPVEC